ncbi:hypothetical protein IWX50DRAFT_703114 [Phyllosticta citricarpa]|uniref:C2H2-type domain-containing protein n=1 Tax=Phyllosticta citricarpa TaxID=55181 RepID=A0ABR1LXM7_9PEZI
MEDHHHHHHHHHHQSDFKPSSSSPSTTNLLPATARPITTRQPSSSFSSHEPRLALNHSATPSSSSLIAPKAAARIRNDGSSRDSHFLFSVSSVVAADDNMPRSVSPMENAPPKYTKTGRISKAKKGLKVHLCESCGKSYTRAEHLRRHQQNHSSAALQCDWPGCGKSFHRNDLLERHKERHNDPTNNERDARGSVSDIERDDSVPPAVLPSSPSTMPHNSQDVSHSPYNGPAITTSSAGEPWAGSGYVRHPVTDLIGVGDGFCDQNFSPEPQYHLHAGDFSGSKYPEIGYDLNPYPAIRPRTLSNASFMEWSTQMPRSPTMNCTQPLYFFEDRDLPIQNLSFYDNTSGPMSYTTSEHSFYANDPQQPFFQPHHPYPTSSYISGPSSVTTASYRSWEDLDTQENRLLFPTQPSAIQHIDPLQVTESVQLFWSCVHPRFPILHRPTFDQRAQPPLALAAVVAVGAQYSRRSGSRAEGRALHERCLQAIEKRERQGVPRSARVCDMQAMFLIELLSQFRSTRCPTNLSKPFRETIRQLSADSTLFEIPPTSLPFTSDERTLHRHWRAWISVSARQRLLIACAILESQSNILLVRAAIKTTVSSPLPLPAPIRAWNAQTHVAWQEAFADRGERLDSFANACALWANLSNTSTPSSHAAGIRDDTQMQASVYAIRLASLAPLGALLAVHDPPWLLDPSLSREEHEAAKSSIQHWIQSCACRSAVAEALAALRFAHDTDNLLTETTPGTELVLFFAALVLWAAATPSTDASRPRRSRKPQSADVGRFLNNAAPDQRQSPVFRDGVAAAVSWVVRFLRSADEEALPGEPLASAVRVLERLQT